MELTRREALVAGAMLWAAPGRCLAAAVPRAENAPLWVSVLLRGGADGLQLAPPRGDRHYQRARGATLDPGAGPSIGSGFSLHPALSTLRPLVEENRLALVPAAGLAHPTRSHFQAQDRLEWGTADARATPSGWLARALATNSGSSLHALALAPTLPMALRGSSSLAVEHPAQLGLASVSRAALETLRSTFSDHSDPASRAGLEALNLWEAIEPALRRTPTAATPRAADRGQALVAGVDQLIALDQRGFPLSTVWLESDGWDTHRAQQPIAARRLADLGSALTRLWGHFAPRRELIAVVTTEFGRTLRPNGSGGTDHGTGSAALVLGSGVRGGVVDAWPGLSESALFEGRDLAALVYLRQVYAETLEAHLRTRLAAEVFPGLEFQSLALFEPLAS